MRPFFRFAFPALLASALALVSCNQPEPSPPAPANPAAPVSKPVQIPKLESRDITAMTSILNDWAKQGHQVQILNPVDNTPGAKVELALAWTQDALLVQVHTDDATPFESSNDLWTGDAIGFTIASSMGSNDCLGFVFRPERIKDLSGPGRHIDDHRSDPPKLVEPQDSITYTPQGYTIEVSIPWANFKHVPQPGDVIGVQVCINDAKGPNPTSHRTWYPSLASDSTTMIPVQLADHADPPEIAMARIHPKGFSTFAVEVLGIADAAGKDVAVWSGEKQIATGKLAPGGFDGDSAADIPLLPDLAAQKDAPLLVTVDGQPLPVTLKVPDLAAVRLGLIKHQPLVASPAIFDGTVFPKIEFLNKDLVEAALGSCILKTRFFDANWNEVTAPSAPGRYGALVEVRTEDGLTCTRQITLFKTAHDYVSAKDPYNVAVKFPAAFGLSDDLAAQENWNTSNWIGGNLEDMARSESNGAALVAALHDIATDPARCRGFSVRKIDGDWWSELRKRQGADQEYLYLTHLPDGYDKDQKPWPLILFLHGSGERGHDLNKVKNQGPLGYINKGHPLPFIIITPECPTDESWSSARLNHLLDEVCAANRVDPKRIYLTGLSMGGYGTWELAGTSPERFAAIAPVAGGEDSGIAERLKKMPTWVFHGSEDTVVPTRYSLDIVKAMQKMGAPVKLTIYPGLGHGGWETTYSNPELYTWFLEHSK